MALGLATSAGAGVFESTGNTDWSLPSTWNLVSGTGTAPPGPGDTAIIRNGHTVTLGSSVTVDSVQVDPGGVLEITNHGVYLSLLALTVDGTLRGQTGGVSSFGGKTVHVIPVAGSAFTVTVNAGGDIRGGQSGAPTAGGGGVFIYDPQGGDLACPTGSTLTVTSGTIEGGSSTGNVYLVAETVTFDGATILGGSGVVPANPWGVSRAGDVYVAGVTVDVLNGSLVQSGTSSNPPLTTGGSTRVIAWSCTGPGVGDATLANSTIDVGGPSIGLCPGAIFNGANTTTTLGAWFIAPAGVGCTFWDPPLVELADDGTAYGDRITVVADDLDARGLATRVVSTPALAATDLLEIFLAPGGTLDLRGLQAGTPYFRAGSQIRLCADQDLILTDADAGLDELMSPAPDLCDPQRFFVLDMPTDEVVRVTHGTLYEHPVAITNIGNEAGSVEIYISDSNGWLIGGPVSTTVTLDPGEPWRTTLAFEIPDGRTCFDEVNISAVTSSGESLMSRLALLVDHCKLPEDSGLER